MRTALVLSTLALAVGVAGPVRIAAGEPIRVTYISAEAIYVDGGKRAGLVAGDTLVVSMGKHAGTRLVVANLSSHSAACRVIDAHAIAVGDVLVAIHPREVAAEQPSSLGQTTKPGSAKTPATPSWRERQAAPNRLRGYVALQGQWQRDLNTGGMSRYEPGLNARIVVENIAGKGLALRFRHLSRWSYRDYSLSGMIDETEWTNRLTEFALVYAKPSSPLEIGVGRVISPYIRGVGYIDGGYLVWGSGSRYHVGFAAGTEPDPTDSSFSPDSRKVGLFVTRDAGTHDGHRLSTTVALTAGYYRDLVSREFVYLQNTYSYAKRLTVYQSVEIDVNRQWRMDGSANRFSFANFYMTSNVVVSRALRLDMSIDARKNVRNYNTMNTPDSLFDDGLSQGINGGLTLSMGRNATLRARAGMRQRDTSRDVQFSSINLNIRHIARSGYNLTARLSRSKSEFTTAYAPLATLRLPLGRRTSLSSGGGGYFYDTLGVTDKNYYLHWRADRSLGGRYALSLGGRRYFGGTLESVEVTTELGVNF
ncbi:MAG: hypothetical protein OEN01_01930 [Candidatus Krumholzibacteria bacterium]|nr:hypothetical protein [Candidatus Krumholzibacteria bacterium]